MDAGMQKLLEARLFGAGLVQVDTETLVWRYNDCLAALGFEPTALTKFRIDGIGWSPEIAEEKNDPLYLTAGIANPRGIILTPEQQGKPVYYPINSFDRHLLAAWFDRYQAAVADITASVGISLDFDNALTTFQSLTDLLLITSIDVQAAACGLFEAAHEQHALVERFEKEPMAWFDKNLRAEIMESGKQWGDLRFRRVDIPSFRFTVGSFHTQALGGAFVFRNLPGDGMLLISETQGQQPKVEDGVPEIFSVTDPKLPEVLEHYALVESDPAFYADHLDWLRGKLDSWLAAVVAKHEPKTNYVNLRLAQKRQRAGKFADQLPSVFHEVERLVALLERKSVRKTTSADLRHVLLRPHHRLASEEREVVWQLLCRMDPSDAIRLYIFDRNRFFDAYREWGASQQEWIIQRLQKVYRPKSR